MDERLYYDEYKDRFNKSDAVRINFKIKNNQAFFVRNAEVSSIVFQILKLDKEISLLCGKLPEVANEQFRRKCLIDEIILTNKIEGVYLTRREISSVLDGFGNCACEKSSKKRFSGMVSQYYKLRAKEHVPLFSCEDIRSLYNELILAEVIEDNPYNEPDGKLFRKEAVAVNTVTEKEFHRGIQPESAICEGVKEALMFLNDGNIELLYRISLFYYLLEYIHPFYAGNGRLARFIMSDWLSRELVPLLSYRISSMIMENINLYYNAFKVCNNSRSLGDITPFLIMMLNMINSAAMQLEETLRIRQARLIRYEKIINALPGTGKERTTGVYHVLIQAGLFSESGITNRDLEKSLSNSYTTIKKELDMVSAKNLLIKNKVGREYFYMLDLEKLDDMFVGSR